MDVPKLFMAILDCINFLQLDRYGRFSEQTYRNLCENETSIGLPSTIQSSANISQAKEKLSPSLHPIFPSQAIIHLGLVTSGQATQETVSVDWKSWASESLTSITMSA